jgi:thiamine-phosphate pyrophosphorylase
VICLVTDRRRFGLRWEAPLLDRVAAAAQAGVSLVQVRERDLDGRDLLALTTRVLDAVRGTATRVVVNERADVARAAGAHGVHLRGLSMDGDRVRSWTGRPWVIGRSVHDRDEAVADTRGGGLDYVLFGTVFDTVSKPGRLAAGVEALADVCGATRVPVLAICGVTPANASRVAHAGAAGIAVMGLFNDTEPTDIPELVGRFREAFTA